ncbi:MAG: hypothetical protein Q9222_000408 [Ikaeria aurantiellina]
MLIPNASGHVRDSLPPPPYTSASSVPAETTDFPNMTSLRGGDARPYSVLNEHTFQSAADYFQERPYDVLYPSYILHHHLIISPNTTRDDLPFPRPEDEYHFRDLNLGDWNTFLNYLMPYDTEPTPKRGRVAELGSKHALRTQDRVQAVVSEWQEGFFGPRGIQIDASFTADLTPSATPPPPFTSTADVGHYPDASSSNNPLPSLQSRPSQPPAPHGRSMPSQPPMPYDTSIASFSSSDFSGADVDQIRHSIATMRQNPAHSAAAVRQFKNDLHQSRREYHNMARGMRGGGSHRGYKHGLKAQRKEMKAELKGLIKEVRVMRKADRKMRRYERKSQRAHRRAERKGVHADAKGQRKLAKAEREALKAQRKAVEVSEMGRVRSMEGERRMRDAGQEDLIWEAPDQRFGRGGGVGEQERGVIPETRGQMRVDEDLAARTRSLGLDGNVRQETGMGVKEG